LTSYTCNVLGKRKNGGLKELIGVSDTYNICDTPIRITIIGERGDENKAYRIHHDYINLLYPTAYSGKDEEVTLIYLIFLKRLYRSLCTVQCEGLSIPIDPYRLKPTREIENPVEDVRQRIVVSEPYHICIGRIREVDGEFNINSLYKDVMRFMGISEHFLTWGVSVGLERGGEKYGILIIGPSGVGKTETALGLVQLGWEFLEDDVTRISSEEIGGTNYQAVFSYKLPLSSSTRKRKLFIDRTTRPPLHIPRDNLARLLNLGDREISMGCGVLCLGIFFLLPNTHYVNMRFRDESDFSMVKRILEQHQWNRLPPRAQRRLMRSIARENRKIVTTNPNTLIDLKNSPYWSHTREILTEWVLAQSREEYGVPTDVDDTYREIFHELTDSVEGVYVVGTYTPPKRPSGLSKLIHQKYTYL